MASNLIKFFREYASKRSIFVNKDALTDKYLPEKIWHRDEQINALAEILAPALRMEKPSNVFIYGKPGTGKTLVVKKVTSDLQQVAIEEGVPVRVVYINCRLRNTARTEYRVIAEIVRELGAEIPSTGIPLSEVYRKFFEVVDKTRKIVILVLDEIDALVKRVGDDILYNLTRANEYLNRSSLSIIGISNDATFTQKLDPRIKSSLGEEEILFPPYDAMQLQDILWDRARIAFIPGAVDKLVIAKCAAYAAREHGDARRALNLLRIAGEIAEREGCSKIKEEHVDKAVERMEQDMILEIVKSQPKQSKLVLLAIIRAIEEAGGPVYTGDVYSAYLEICKIYGVKPLSQRRVSDLISELDMLGIITAKVVSKGRYGRTREIDMYLSEEIKRKIIEAIVG